MAQAPGAGSGPVTTIPPFDDSGKLPACATLCGPLFDANGACVPPQVPTNTAAADQMKCFCNFNKLAPFSTGASGVCPTGVPNACKDGDLSSIANWYQGACNVAKNANGGGGGDGGDSQQSSTAGGSESGGKSGSSGSSKSGGDGGGGGDWISTHYQWVIMLIVLVLGIAGIWVGACIWRRRYLRKKDRQHLQNQRHSGSAANPSWGPPAVAQSPSPTPETYADERGSGVRKLKENTGIFSRRS